jgi:hypothetical protein
MNELPILSALMLKHLICDYPLQTPYQFMNKGIYGHPGGLLHVGIHAVGTLIALWFFAPLTSALGFALLDAFIHYHIDWAKNHINRRFNLKPTGGAGFWFTFGLDQYLHQMTYILLVYLLVHT